MELDLSSDSLSGGWMKKLGMVVMPASTKPLTPVLVSSNCSICLALSCDSVLFMVAAAIIGDGTPDGHNKVQRERETLDGVRDYSSIIEKECAIISRMVVRRRIRGGLASIHGMK